MEWISTENYFPDIGQEVVITDGQTYEIAWTTEEESWDSYDSIHLEKITHWMYIPELPK